MIEWSNVGSGDMVLEMDSGVTELTLVVDRISQSMNDRMYRCRVIMGNSTISNTVALTIEGEPTNNSWPLLPQGVLELGEGGWYLSYYVL